MGIFKSTGNAICAVLDTVTDVGEAAGKTVGMATTYVDNRATKQRLVDKQSVMTDTAEALAELQTRLEADEKVAAIYKQLEKEFN